MRCSSHSMAYAHHSPQNTTQLVLHFEPSGTIDPWIFFFFLRSSLVVMVHEIDILRSGVIIAIVVCAQIPSALQAENLFFCHEEKPGAPRLLKSGISRQIDHYELRSSIPTSAIQFLPCGVGKGYTENAVARACMCVQVFTAIHGHARS